MKGGGVLRNASQSILAGFTAALLTILAVGPATADDYVPTAYIEGTVSAPPGTKLDQLQIQISEIQSNMNHTPIPVAANGRYRAPYSWLENANIKVLGGQTGLADTWYGNVPRQEDSTNIAVNRRTVTGVDIAMAPGSVITGVISAPAGTDLTALTVVATSKFVSPHRSTFPATVRSAGVAPDGGYRISGLGASDYTIEVQPGANALLSTWYGSGSDKQAAKPVKVGTGTDTSGININVLKPASLSGTAIFPAGSTPAAGFVSLSYENGNRLASTNFGTDGAFRFPQVPPGPFKLQFGGSAPELGFAFMWYPTAGQFGAAEPLNLAPGEIRSDLKLAMKPAGSITGTVSGAGAVTVEVRLLDPLGRIVNSARTDAAGKYSMDRIGPGNFKVRFGDPTIRFNSSSLMPQFYPGIAEGSGYRAGADVTVNSGQVTAGIDAKMTQGGTVSGIILDPDSLPLESHSVNTVSLGGSAEGREASTDREGRFSISGLSDGDYILETNFSPYSSSLYPLGHLYSGNVRDREKAQTFSIRNSQPVDAGTLSYATAGLPPSKDAGKFVPVTPTRILDTRTTHLPVAPNTKRIVQVAGKAGIPADASAVALNLTVTEPLSYGAVYAVPFGGGVPQTSNVNYDEQETVPNYVIVPIKDGRIFLGTEGPGAAHLIADVAGYFTGGLPADAGGYHPLTPFRAADSRGTGGTPGGQQFDVQLAGLSKMPADVGAVVVNLTAARVWSLDAKSHSSYGYLTAFATGTARPATSNLNYEWTTGDTPNLAVVPVSADGKISIANTSPGSVGIIVDVMGYFKKGQASTAGTYQSTAPKRLMDTRLSSAPVGAGKDINVAVAGANTVPAGAKAAMVNLTVTESKSYGYLTAYPAGKALPNASNVNYSQGQTVANFAVVPIGADGKITVRNTSAGATHVVVDLVGYILG